MADNGTSAAPRTGRPEDTAGSVSRRLFIVGGSVMVVAAAIGCDEATPGTRADVGVKPDGPHPADGGVPDSVAGDGATANREPVWTTIPDQVWTVGVPVSLDLAAYCTDADKDALTFALSGKLPDGLTLKGSVISGTPTAVFAAAPFTAMADDGRA